MNDPSTEPGERVSDEELRDAVPRATGGREVRVGIFVLFGIIAFVAVLFLLTDPATMRGRYMLVTTVSDAGGVRRGDPIQMRGVIIGRVRGFEMMPTEQVAITLELEDEWRIPEGSRTQLGGSGLFGGRTLEVVPSDMGSYYAEWDTMPGADAGDADIMAMADELGGQAGVVMERIQALLDPGTVASVQGSATELEVLLRDLSTVIAEQRVAMRNLTASLGRSAAGLEEFSASGPDAARAVARADSAMLTLATTSRTLDDASRTLQTVLGRMERGEGTLGRLSRDEALYVNLNTAAERMAALMADIQANPGRYINLSIF